MPAHSSPSATHVLTDESGRRYALVPLTEPPIAAPGESLTPTGVTLPTHLLTPRETEVALHVVRGRSNKHIAAMCGISEGTVKTYVHRLFRKLRAGSRVELVLRLQEEHGIRAASIPAEKGD